MSIGLSTTSARALPRSAGLSGVAGPAALLGPEALVDRAQRAGAVGLMLDDSLPPGYLAELMVYLAARRAELPVWAVENVCPAARWAAADLGALDRDEALAAVEAAEQSIRVAGELAGGEGGAMVLLRLGEVAAIRSRWPALRRAFLRAELDETTLTARLQRERAAHAPRHVDALRRSLARLCRAAEAHGVRLGLRNPARPIGLPSPVELRALLDDLAGAPIVPALDLGAAHLHDAMEQRPLAETLDGWKGAPLILCADACGPVAGLPPGRGELDLGAALATASAEARVVFTPSAILDEGEILAGAAALVALRP